MENLPDNVCAKKDMVVYGAINVYPVITIIQIVFHAIVLHWVVFQLFVMSAESVRVYQALLENNVPNVVPAIMHIQNVFVSYINI